jgi:hypothetical protein
MDFLTLFGVIGTMLILFAFFMNQSGRWKASSRRYDIVNMIGSLILVIFALETNSLPFLILNSVWFAIAFRDVVKPMLKKK